MSGCQSLLCLSDLLDKIARGRKYQKVWVIKTLSSNIIKGILKSMTSIWKDIFHTLSSTVGDMAEQKQVKQGVLLMKVLVEKAAGDKMKDWRIERLEDWKFTIKITQSPNPPITQSQITKPPNHQTT